MESNIIVRMAKKEDIPAFQQLWEMCFRDSESFRQWLFSQRFYPEYSAVLEKDGEILSCMQGVPYTIMVRDKEVAGAMLCGVSTHTEHRGKGYMGKLFTFTMNLLNQQGLLLAVHTPAVLPSYFSYGHFPVADAAYFFCPSAPEGKIPDGISYYAPEKYTVLYPLYENHIGKRYSGSIRRTEKEFLRKCDDYGVDDAKCLVYEDSELRGYAFIYDTEESVVGIEVVAEDGYYHKLLEGIMGIGRGKEISVKLPPEVISKQPVGEVKRQQKGVAGVANMQGLLKALAISCDHAVEILDHVVAKNQGVFSLDGEVSEKKPAIKVDAGHFLGVLLGYVTLNEIREFVTIYDEVGFENLNVLLEKRNCYIIDEY